jgi:hypothetical protein
MPSSAEGINMEATLNKQTSKLPEGWHFTEKYGYVFVSPGGIAWLVERQGNKLESVSGSLTKDDIIGKTAIEKRQVSIRNQRRRPVSHQL